MDNYEVDHEFKVLRVYNGQGLQEDLQPVFGPATLSTSDLLVGEKYPKDNINMK